MDRAGIHLKVKSSHKLICLKFCSYQVRPLKLLPSDPLISHFSFTVNPNIHKIWISPICIFSLFKMMSIIWQYTVKIKFHNNYNKKCFILKGPPTFRSVTLSWHEGKRKQSYAWDFMQLFTLVHEKHTYQGSPCITRYMCTRYRASTYLKKHTHQHIL